MEFNYIIILKASGSPHYENEEIITRFLEIYRKNEQFEMVTVDGSHHVHLNNPERVVPAIVSFLKNVEYNSSEDK